MNRFLPTFHKGIPVADEQKRLLQPGFSRLWHDLPEASLYDVCGVLFAGPRRHDVEYANAKAVLWQIDVQPADETCGRCRTGPRTAHRRAREDSDSILVFGRARRLDVWQSPLLHRGAQGHTGPGAEFSQGNHIGVVGRDFLNDPGQAGAAAMLNVPGKEFHGFPDWRRPALEIQEFPASPRMGQVLVKTKEGEMVMKNTTAVKDPVCGMDIETATAAGRTKHKGETYYFCGPKCKAKFDLNPEQYLGKQAGTPKSGHGCCS